MCLSDSLINIFIVVLLGNHALECTVNIWQTLLFLGETTITHIKCFSVQSQIYLCLKEKLELDQVMKQKKLYNIIFRETKDKYEQKIHKGPLSHSCQPELYPWNAQWEERAVTPACVSSPS